MKNKDLIEKAVTQKVGMLSGDGALVVRTGSSTGRSPKERFVVRHSQVEKDIDWGTVNRAVDTKWAGHFFEKLGAHLRSQKTETMSGFVGCFKVKVTSTSPWHVAFAQNMFREQKITSLENQISEDIEITIFHEPNMTPQQLGIDWEYDKAIIVDPYQMTVGIIGTGYAGEIKKSAFSLCNYALPQYGILPMHSSANCLQNGSQSSVLFGLSGTGKTTLSADPERYLIGDDEIIWSKKGLSNMEGGCYAKLIQLDPKNEPDIYQAANRYGSILENVGFNDKTKEIDFYDNSITENTRGSYSLDALTSVFDQTHEADHPSSIVFLTADAFGALPAVARLDEWQTQYHFVSGYTAKVAGTEMGVTEPQATFSACFGAPFMPRSASVYAGLLAEMAKKHNVSVWLLNTGWTGGGFGVGKRFPIPVSRKLLRAIQSGDLDEAPMKKHPVFGFMVPEKVPGIDEKYLMIPEGEAVEKLAQKFIQNAKDNRSAFSDDIIKKGGPF